MIFEIELPDDIKDEVINSVCENCGYDNHVDFSRGLRVGEDKDGNEIFARSYVPMSKEDFTKSVIIQFITEQIKKTKINSIQNQLADQAHQESEVLKSKIALASKLTTAINGQTIKPISVEPPAIDEKA